MKVLIIEDSVRLQQSIRIALKKSGYTVDAADEGEQGLWLMESGSYDVVILDWMLPKMDGLTLLKAARQKGLDTHVLILTARDAVEDRIRGLDTGADDYLTKPFSIDELLARVAALVRRSYGQKNPILSAGNLRIEINQQEAFVGDQPVKLTPREYKLLEYLARRSAVPVTRTEIEAHLYGDETDLLSNAIDSTISVLRKKMAELGCTARILTRRGVGYLLEGNPR